MNEVFASGARLAVLADGFASQDPARPPNRWHNAAIIAARKIRHHGFSLKA